MTPQAWWTLGVVVGSLLAMMRGVASPDRILLGAVVLLSATGVLTPAEAFAGFANPGVLTVAALFVVAAGLRGTGAVHLATARILGRPRSPTAALARMVPPVVLASAFLNNTTIVASLLPGVHDAARRNGIAPSQLLMPLSFASILGGTCTLVGTSTNLVVAGLIEAMRAERTDLQALEVFSITSVGLPVALAGAAVLVFLAPRLLPSRDVAVSVDDDPRHYTAELRVPEGSRLVGQTIEAAGLRHLPSAFLMEIVRDDEVIPVVDGSCRLEGGDRLVFVGARDAMVDLQRLPGLAVAPDHVFRLSGAREDRRILEAVVSPRNPLVGSSIRGGRFRSRFDAVAIAVARGGRRLPGRLGDIVLQTGDVLLLEAGPHFDAAPAHRDAFVLVSDIPDAAPPRFEHARTSLLILAVLLVVLGTGLLPTVTAAMIAAGAMVLTRCCSAEEARRSLHLQVLVAIAAAFGLGAALQRTGLDAALADAVIGLGADDPWLGLIAIYVVTAVLTELVTNNAAAVLAVPLAVALADRVGASPMPYLVAVMMAASASFLTPVGYQTNLMVFNAGGYRPTDFLRLGLPLALVTGATTLWLVPWAWPLHP